MLVFKYGVFLAVALVYYCVFNSKQKKIVNCFKNFCTNEFCFYDAAKLSNNIG